VLEVSGEVCVCWLVDCPTLAEDISFEDEVNSDVLSIVEDGEDGEVPVVDIVVSSVEPLSPVDDSKVVVLIGDIAVVNVE